MTASVLTTSSGAAKKPQAEGLVRDRNFKGAFSGLGPLPLRFAAPGPGLRFYFSQYS